MRVDINNLKLFTDTFKILIPNVHFPNVKGLSIDSRKIQPGDIFLPLKGESQDGHDYLEYAKS
mgnify:CR=1 FL=1